MQPLYFVETQSSKLGRWFIECDRDSNSRAYVIDLIRKGEVDPVKVLEIDEDEGSCRDVTEEFLHCAKWGDHEVSRDEIARTVYRTDAQFDHAQDLRKNWEPAQ